MTPGLWHHVVFTKSGASVAIYLDGAPVGSGLVGYVRPASTDAAHHWGAGQGEHTSADFDELAIYPRALSATTVSAHHDAGHPWLVPFLERPPSGALVVSGQADVTVSGLASGTRRSIRRPRCAARSR